MDIGQRIKQARLEAGLSQRQLCGDTITRNMLSLIESGKARPGMDTLAVLAARLGKPMGWFLEEQAVLSPNQDVIARARLAFAQKDWTGVLSNFVDYKEPDSLFDWEKNLLEAVCRTELAEQAVGEDRKIYARELLEQARLAGEKTPYFTREWEQRRLRIGCYLEPTGDWTPACPDETLTALARQAFTQGAFARCGALLEAVEQRSAAWYLLRGQSLLEQGLPEQAAPLLHRAEESFEEECAPLLERCYRDTGDFKRAYEYACKQR